MTPTTPRKGARSIQLIPQDVLDRLNAGMLETANMVEWLAVDQRLLLRNLLHQLGREPYIEPVLQAVDALAKSTVNTRNEAIGLSLLHCSLQNDDSALFAELAGHPSDVVRCWACYLAGRAPGLNLAQLLERIRPFAADPHFGVREISWLVLRPAVAQALPQAIGLLQSWTSDPDENIRRFASEITRPRGVWCAHIEALKRDPELGLPILLPLFSDPSRYVQNSVANWLNDASKTRPDFVQNLCAQWSEQSNSPETAYIVKRGLRSM
jgi:3-methyladenine DNA glycosylase AlkC